MNDSKITIVGAGPAGLTAAIFLGKYGYPATLIEKDSFPRDKICGDCLGGYVLSVLAQINDQLFEQFVRFEKKRVGKGVHFFGPQHQKISFPAVNLVKNKINEVVLSKRKDFDSFLFDEAKRYNTIDCITGVRISRIIKNQNHLILSDENESFKLKTDLLILASGSVGMLGRKLTGEKLNKKHYAAGIRTYFENISGLDEDGFIELHFLKEIAPGYLWIFPLPDNVANVGLGLRSDVLSRNPLNLKDTFHDILRNNEYFKDRFKDACQLEEIKGSPLALGGKKRQISGDHFLLAGDSAHLIEPLFGEGIGQAMYSGKFAAEHAIECVRNGNFSASFNKAYDRRVYSKLGSALKFSKWMNNVAQHPSLMRFLFNKVSNNEKLKNHLFRIINGQISKTPLNGTKLITQLLFSR